MGHRKTAVQIVTPEKIQAVQMSMDGMTSDQIGEVLGKDGSTIRRWFQQPEVMEEYRSILRSAALPMVSKAIRNVLKDLDSEAANGYLRQNASLFVLNRYEKALLGDTDGSCTITFVNGIPDIGMPDPTDDDDDDE